MKYYLKPHGRDRFSVDRAIDNLWDDIPGLGTTPGEDLGYPTQKTEALLTRVIAAATNPGDIVLDCFAGSGTTPAVAQKMGRRWIACDAGIGAIQTITKRMYWVQHEDSAPQAAQSFSVYRSPSVGLDEQVETGISIDVHIERESGDVPRLRVKVNDYASDALDARMHVATPPETVRANRLDWRVFVDSIMIDGAYDGEVFRPTVVDAPRRRAELVSGTYDLPAPVETATVTIRLIDILGHEVVVSKQV